MSAMSSGGSLGQQPPNAMTPNEKFFRYFQHEVTDIEDKIERLSSHGTSGGERADAVEHCLASIARLSDEVKDASSYLPPYDQRTYGEAVKALTSKLHEIRAAFAPRPKFAFKGGSIFTAKKNESAISLNDAAALAHERRRQISGYGSDVSNESSFATTPTFLHSPNPEPADLDTQHASTDDSGYDGNRPDFRSPGTQIRQPSFSQSTAVSISNHDGIHIVLPAAASHAMTSGTLSNIHRCVVDMSNPTSQVGRGFAGLTLRNISESLIVCGHVDGAAHLTRLSHTTIVVASRQFRMHDSRNCDVYLLCASRPIIEDCTGIRFAPLPDVYLKPGDQKSENRWRDVDDFKWLRAEPSPNWSSLEPSQRVKEDVWREVVPGGPGIGTEDVLKAVNVP